MRNTQKMIEHVASFIVIIAVNFELLRINKKRVKITKILKNKQKLKNITKFYIFKKFKICKNN